MNEDWFIEAVDRVAEAGRRACREIERAVCELDAGRAEHLSGRPLVEVVDELIRSAGPSTRKTTAQAFRDYERAIGTMRATVVRLLVDEHGQTFTEVARRLTVSRQAIARLYQQGSPSELASG